MNEPEIRRDDAGSRYVITLDGVEVGSAFFERQPGTLILTHTEIDPAYEGQHLGTTLIRWALEDMRSRGESIVPLCPFVVALIKRNQDYVDLVVDASRPSVFPDQA